MGKTVHGERVPGKKRCRSRDGRAGTMVKFLESFPEAWQGRAVLWYNGEYQLYMTVPGFSGAERPPGGLGESRGIIERRCLGTD